MAQGTGTVIIKVNGKMLEGRAVKFKWGGFSRELQMSAGVYRHYISKPEASQVTVTIMHMDGFDLDEIRNWENVTLVCECDNGPTYQIDGACVTNSPELGDEGAGVTLEFGGPPAQAV